MITPIEDHDGTVVNLEFDEKAHYYRVDGEYVPSVTTVLDNIAIKALPQWAASEGAKWYLANHESDIAPEDMAKGIRGAFRKKSREALDIGTLVHEYAEKAILWKIGSTESDSLTLKDVPEMPDNEIAVKCINAFRGWVRENDVEWLKAEQKLYNRKYKYAGTVDAIANINGEFCVIDFNTSGAIYDKYYLQCAAYAECVEDMWGKDVDSYWVLRFDKKTGKFEAGKSTDSVEDFSGFYGALMLYSRLKTRENQS